MMKRANKRSGDELVKYPMVGSMTINLDVFSAFMKCRIVDKKYYSLVITIKGHETLY